MKYKKSFVPWLMLIIVWNFGFPHATPTQDVLVSIFLYFGVTFLDLK